MKKMLLYGFLLILMSIPMKGYGQTEITGLPFLTIGSSSQSIGMGESTVALSGYIGSSHYNPASIGSDGVAQLGSLVDFQDGLSLNRNARYSETGFSDFHASLKYDNWAYSASVKYYKSTAGVPRIGRPQNTHEPNEYAINLTSAYTFNFGLSLGLGINFINSNLEDSFAPLDGNLRMNKVSFDVGALYNRTVKLSDEVNFKPSIGLSVTDFGSTIDYKDVNRDDALPMTFRSGIATTFETARTWQDRSFVSLTLAGSISKIMARRNDDGTPYGPFRALFASWDSYEYADVCFFGGCSTSDISLKDQLNTQLGMEFFFFETVHFRLGRNHEAFINGDDNYTSLGFGLELYYLQLDYTNINYDDEFDGIGGGNFSMFQVTGRIPINSRTASFLKFNNK